MDVRERTTRLLFLCCVVLIGARAQALELNGVASFGELGEEIYLAGLYIDWRSSEPADYFSDYRERKMEVRFSSSLSRRRWANSWMQSIAINNSRQHLEEAAEELSYLLSTFEGHLFRGDQVEIHYRPDTGTELRLNGHILASGHSAAVFNLFISSWVGPVPPSSQFRAALLGLESSTDSTRFVTLQPAVERIEAVGSWTSVRAQSGETATPEAVAAADPDPEPVEDVAESLATPAEIAVTAAALPDEGENLVERMPRPELVQPTLAQALGAEIAEPVTDYEPDVTAAPPAVPIEPAADADETTVLDDGHHAADAFGGEDGELDLSVAAILGQRDYLSQLIRDVYSNIRYPDRAVRRSYEGDVRMRLIIERSGGLADMQMIQGARHQMLNDEAERAVLAATPFPAIPEEVRGERIEVELPINFRLE